MREQKNQMLGTMEPPLMQLSVKRGSPRFAKPVSSAPSFSGPVFKRTTAFLANKIPFPIYARHTVYNLFASTGPFQLPPDNRQKWGV